MFHLTIVVQTTVKDELLRQKVTSPLLRDGFLMATGCLYSSFPS